MLLSAIVAYSENYVIGKDNQIPWHLPNDLKYFKRVTLGYPVIMGRKCFESIGRPLPKRRNIIITRNEDYYASGCLITHSLDEAIELAAKEDPEEIFILGGAEIYRLSMDQVNRLYITEVHATLEGDTYFPEPDWSEWDLGSEEAHKADDRNPYDYTFKVYTRKE